MDATLDHRIARVIARRKEELARDTEAEDHQARNSRLTRDKVLSELPRLLTKISSAVSELNDLLLEADMSIKVEVAVRTPLSDAMFKLSLAHPGEQGPVLELTVDFVGNLRGVLTTREARVFLESSNIFLADRTSVMKMLVALLEAHYP
jgi:hypothetical protein